MTLPSTVAPIADKYGLPAEITDLILTFETKAAMALVNKQVQADMAGVRDRTERFIEATLDVNFFASYLFVKFCS